MAFPHPHEPISHRRLAGDVVVSAVGMTSPVGASANQSFASVRAGIDRIAERPEIYFCLPDDPVTEDPQPLVASAITHLESKARSDGRPAEWLALLAGHAYRDLRRGAGLGRADDAQVGLFFSLPPARSGRADWSEASRSEFTLRFHDFAERDLSAEPHVAFTGHTGALALCEQACALLQERKLRWAAIGGVDSYLFPEWLAPLDAQYRVKSGRNMDGFVPGEAAAFFLLELEDQAKRRGQKPWARIEKIASGRCGTLGGAPNTGSVLTQLLHGLLAGETESPLVVCDLNGELNRMREWGYAVARLGGALRDGALEHPAVVLGDVGAASGASLVALAVQFMRKKHRDRRSAVVWAASDAGERRALLLGIM